MGLEQRSQNLNNVNSASRAHLEIINGRVEIVGGTSKQRRSKLRKILYDAGITPERQDEMIRRKYPL